MHACLQPMFERLVVADAVGKWNGRPPHAVDYICPCTSPCLGSSKNLIAGAIAHKSVYGSFESSRSGFEIIGIFQLVYERIQVVFQCIVKVRSCFKNKIGEIYSSVSETSVSTFIGSRIRLPLDKTQVVYRNLHLQFFNRLNHHTEIAGKSRILQSEKIIGYVAVNLFSFVANQPLNTCSLQTQGPR